MKMRTAALAAATAAGLLLGMAQQVLADPVVAPGVTPTGMRIVNEVSSTGRLVVGNAKSGPMELLDLTTMTRTPASYSTFVIDNPDLTVRNETGWIQPTDPAIAREYRAGPVWLDNTTTGSRQRVDTDAAGNALVPAWAATCDEDCAAADNPTIRVDTESVSRDGRIVAFCANYTSPTTFDLYVKDLATGQLLERQGLCEAGGPVEIRTEEGGFRVRAPQVSEDGKVVHVQGATPGDGFGDTDAAFYRDSLFFPRTGKVRTVNGQGSMTRDGKLLFMRIGTRPYLEVDRTGGKVGIYNVATKKTARLPGRYTIYGTNALIFSAFDQATRHGRYVTYGDRAAVIDRTTGVTVDLGAMVRAAGFEPTSRDELRSAYFRPRISSNGSTVLVSVGQDPANDSGGEQMVAVTGWHPAATVRVKPILGASRLFVDVNPNKGRGYWSFTVQRLNPDGTWSRATRTLRTQGTKETRTVNLKAGTYRVVVKAKYGYLGTTSTPVNLSR
jgi:hypothetical protein